LIPARNEELGIAAAVRSIAANTWRELEILVMDDHSSDRTAEIVQSLSKSDSRIHLANSLELPPGWNGKQHACWQAAQLAQGELLLFMDADVRLQPDAIERYVAQFDHRRAKLLSGFPNQEQGTLSEALLIPLMYVVLLGYLPLDQMRASVKPEFGAGCGQLFLAEREAYFACKGHQAIAGSRHDGLKLPRAFRSAGHMTDLFDASDLATVRMYRGWREVTRGLLKNATEGIANPKLILVFSVLLIGGFTAPVLSFAHALFYGWKALPTVLLGLATLLSFLPRALIARRLGHSPVGVILNPLAILLFVMLQWMALVRQATGLGTVAWRGRT
jgi:glycosyltransferase involved in cell wall biosynthesis